MDPHRGVQIESIIYKCTLGTKTMILSQKIFQSWRIEFWKKVASYVNAVLNNFKLFCFQFIFNFLSFFLMFKNWGHKTLSGILFWFILLKSPSKVMHVHKFLDQLKKFFLEFLPTYCVRQGYRNMFFFLKRLKTGIKFKIKTNGFHGFFD